MSVRERVEAEVVWVASVGYLDCEGRSVQSWRHTDHDTEGDARRHMVAEGLFERDTPGWGKEWRDDSGYRIGSVKRTIREVTG